MLARDAVRLGERRSSGAVAEVQHVAAVIRLGDRPAPDAARVELTDEVISDLLRFRETVAMGIADPTLDDRRRWLDILQATVTVTNGVAVVTCRLGGNPLRYNLFEINKS